MGARIDAIEPSDVQRVAEAIIWDQEVTFAALGPALKTVGDLNHLRRGTYWNRLGEGALLGEGRRRSTHRQVHGLPLLLAFRDAGSRDSFRTLMVSHAPVVRNLYDPRFFSE